MPSPGVKNLSLPPIEEQKYAVINADANLKEISMLKDEENNLTTKILKRHKSLRMVFSGIKFSVNSVTKQRTKEITGRCFVVLSA